MRWGLGIKFLLFYGLVVYVNFVYLTSSIENICLVIYNKSHY